MVLQRRTITGLEQSTTTGRLKQIIPSDQSDGITILVVFSERTNSMSLKPEDQTQYLQGEESTEMVLAPGSSTYTGSKNYKEMEVKIQHPKISIGDDITINAEEITRIESHCPSIDRYGDLKESQDALPDPGHDDVRQNVADHLNSRYPEFFGPHGGIKKENVTLLVREKMKEVQRNAGYDPIAIAASLIKQNAGTISKVATGEESRR